MNTEYTFQQHSGSEFIKTVQEAKSRRRQPFGRAVQVTGNGNSVSSTSGLAKYEKRLSMLKLQADGDNFATGSLLARTLKVGVH